MSSVYIHLIFSVNNFCFLCLLLNVVRCCVCKCLQACVCYFPSLAAFTLNTQSFRPVAQKTIAALQLLPLSNYYAFYPSLKLCASSHILSKAGKFRGSASTTPLHFKPGKQTVFMVPPSKGRTPTYLLLYPLFGFVQSFFLTPSNCSKRGYLMTHKSWFHCCFAENLC